VSSFSSATIGRLASAIAVVAIVGLICIALFAAIGGPFGTLNDICVGLGGVLSGGLAWVLYPTNRASAPRLSQFALGTNVVGAAVSAVGSGLVIFNVTGWFLAGLVTTFGYSLIGLWLLATNLSAARTPTFPGRLARFGIVAGGVTASGVLAGPGILARTDAIGSALWFVSASIYVGGLGWSILYTIWCLWLGRLLLSKRVDLGGATTA
jgi:hypothetical protein